MNDTPSTEQACTDRFIKRRILWHSDRDGKETIDHYADKLTLIQIDDRQWALELDCSGTVVRLPIKNIEKYV